jgi:hypothetical protein
LVYSFGHSAAEYKPAFDALRNKTFHALGVQPYLVDMGGGGNPANLGADAVSRYVTGASGSGKPFEDAVAAPERGWWAKQVEAGHKVVPPISAGWDARPRVDLPCPWGVPGPNWSQDPSMKELAAHTAAGLKFAQDNTEAAEAETVMISAWNEHDEGHWIEPALDAFGGAEKLQAIHSAIRAAAVH